MGSLILKFIVGGVAGLLAWVVMEPMRPSFESAKWVIWEANFMLLLGAVVGLAIGGLDGFTRGGRRHTLSGLGLGLLFGAVGASLGHGLGAGLMQVVFPSGVLMTGALPVKIMARTLAFIPLGAFLGAGIGLSSLSVKKGIQGAIGGALGAAIGGMSFDLLGSLTANAQLSVMQVSAGEVGGPSRALSTMIMGAAIGLFIGLVDRLARSAWLKLSLGRNEGKEWNIDGGQTFIGRSESAQVPLFGDMNVAPIHASIQKQGRQYLLLDGGSPAGTLLNGQYIQQAVLTPGSVIQIGQFALTFLVKGVPAPARPVDGGYYAPQSQMAPQMAPAPVPAPMPAQMPTQVPTSMQAPVSGQLTVQMNGQLGGQGSMPTQMYSPAPAMGVCIVVLDGPMMGQRIPVSGPMELGREATGVRLSADTAASRRHAQIAPANGGLQISDLGSTNGTFLNGQPVQSAMARIGEVFRVGSTNFRIESN